MKNFLLSYLNYYNTNPIIHCLFNPGVHLSFNCLVEIIMKINLKNVKHSQVVFGVVVLRFINRLFCSPVIVILILILSLSHCLYFFPIFIRISILHKSYKYLLKHL